MTGMTAFCALAVDEHTCTSQQRAEASLSAAKAEHKVYGAARLKAIPHHCLVFVELFAAEDETLNARRDSCLLLYNKMEIRHHGKNIRSQVYRQTERCYQQSPVAYQADMPEALTVAYLNASFDLFDAILWVNKDRVHFVEEDLHPEDLALKALCGLLCSLL